jgi:hypothetical protein
MLVNTVGENKSKYTNADYLRASLARKLQMTIGRPSTSDFINIVEKNLLPNCPISRRDIMIAEDIFGPDVGSLKGKTMRSMPNKVRPGLVDIPANLLSQYCDVTICADIMFVNKIPFLVTISRSIKFGTAEMLANRQAKTLSTAMKNAIRLYKGHGFNVPFVIIEGEFEEIRGDLADEGVTLNTTSKAEHVGDIECYIRTVKERCRCIYNTLPLNKMPARLIIEMVYTSVFWLNSFPNRNGISDQCSPQTIVVGQQIDYNSHC